MAAVLLLLGVAWGAIAAAPFALAARRPDATTRGRRLRDRGVPIVGEVAPAPPRLGAVGRVWRGVRERRSAAREHAALVRELPVVVDLLGVAVGAGCVPFTAIDVAARWSPPRAAGELERVTRRCALGASFESALAKLARAAPALRPVADALLVSDSLGAPVGPALARLAAEARADARRRAEAHARTVPVRLLFPLVFLVLPAFGLLTVVPTLVGGFARA